jgi:arylsulfatase A
MRSVPGIAWWPGTIAAGSVTDALASTMDMFVTAVELAGGQLPTDRTYDGRSLVPLLRSPR